MSEFADVVVDESDLTDGFSAHDIFSHCECQGITFDDLIVLPGEITFGVGDVGLQARITKNITLSTPLCSTPMDTVTESSMAIAMALNGGVGFIHANCSAERQIAMVSKVKAYENGFIMEPAVLAPYNTIEDLDMLKSMKKISGVPVTVDGRSGSKLVGLISNRDTDFLANRKMRIYDVMTPFDKLVTGQYPLTIEEANSILKTSKRGYLPVIDADGNLKALTTRTDLKKQQAYPQSSKDKSGKLLVGAAVKAGARDELDMARVLGLYEAGCDIIVLDAQNGDCERQVEFLKAIKEACPGLEVMAGNVVRSSQAKMLLEAGADAIRVGMGVGSVSTKQLVSAVGRAQLSAVYSCARMAKKYNVPVIADGGLKNTGCIIKALAIGADCVMMGSLLAGTDESPGDYYYQNGIRLKSYNANNHRATEETITSSTSTTTSPVGSPMGSPSKPRLSSLDAQGRSSSFDFTYSTKSIQNVTYRVASGVSGAVVDKGKMDRYFPYLIQSIRHGLQDMGTESLKIMKEQLFSGALRFELRSASAQKEGGVHDLHSFQQRLFA